MPVSLVTSAAQVRQLGDELGEGGRADAVLHAAGVALQDFVGDRRVFGHAEEDPLGAFILREAGHDFAETLGQPAFGRAVFGAGAEAEARACPAGALGRGGNSPARLRRR